MEKMISFNHNYEFITGLLAAYKRHNNDNDLDFIECPNTDYVNEFIDLIGNEYEIINNYLKCGITKDCSDIAYLAISLNEDFSINKELASKSNIKERLSFGNFSDLSQNLMVLSKKIQYDDFFQKNKKFFDFIINTLYEKNANINQLRIFDFYNLEDFKKYSVVISGFINGAFSCSLDNNVTSIIGLKNENGKYIEDTYSSTKIIHEFSHSEVNPLVDKYFNLFENLDLLKLESINNGLPDCYKENALTILYEYFVRANTYVLAMENYDDYMKEDELVYYESIGFIHIRDIVNTILLKRENYNSYEELFIKELIPLFNGYANDLNKSSKMI